MLDVFTLLDHYETLKSQAWERCSALTAMKYSTTGWLRGRQPTIVGKSTKSNEDTILQQLLQGQPRDMFSSSISTGWDGQILWYSCVPQGNRAILNSVGQLVKGNKGTSY